MIKRYLKVLLFAICAMVLTGCGSQKNESAESEQTQEAVAEETTEEETEAEKIEVSFEEMNYNAFLKNEAGEEVVGFHIPFGWGVENQDEDSAFLTEGNYSSNYVSISYVPKNRAQNPSIYSDMPDSFLTVNDDGAYDEYYDAYEIEYIGEGKCPYGKVYKYIETITDTNTAGEKYTYYELNGLIEYKEEMIFVSTSIDETEEKDKANDILDDTLQMLFDPQDEAEEIPEGYEYYLETEDGTKLLGYHMPEGWQFSEFENSQSFAMTIWIEGKSISLQWLYGDFANDYEELYETGKELNPYDSEGYIQEYQTELKDEVDSPYGTIKIYDMMTHYVHPDGWEGDGREEIGLFKWNGQLFWIYYSDANRDVEEGYEGALKELIQQLF